RRHLERDRRLGLRRRLIRIEREPAAGAESDARKVPEAVDVEREVANGDDCVVEAVAVDVAERNDDGLTAEVDRGERLRGLGGGKVQRLAERRIEVDLVAARPERNDELAALDERLAGHGDRAARPRYQDC